MSRAIEYDDDGKEVGALGADAVQKKAADVERMEALKAKIAEPVPAGDPDAEIRRALLPEEEKIEDLERQLRTCREAGRIWLNQRNEAYHFIHLTERAYGNCSGDDEARVFGKVAAKVDSLLEDSDYDRAEADEDGPSWWSYFEWEGDH